MTKDKEKKVGKDQLLLDASRLGQSQQLESILSQFQQLKSKKRSNPLASLRKIVGPNNIRDPVTGFTCLHHASLNGHAQCVKLILDYGAKLNAVDYKGSSALHLAAWAGNLEVVKILLNYRATVSPKEESHHQSSQQSQESPTHLYGCNKQQLQTIDIDLCNNDNQTPLSLAAQFGHNDVVQQLLAHGANVHIRNGQLESPLDLACLNNRLETVNLLLKSSPSLVFELKRARSTLLLNRSGDGHLSSSTAASVAATDKSGRPMSMSLSVDHQSPANCSLPASHTQQRRPSTGGGWSSLLRGGRTRSGDSNQAACASGQSPLHRLTAATLSMRQKSPNQQAVLPPTTTGANNSPQREEVTDSVRRRATLTVGAPLHLNNNGHQQQQAYLAAKQIGQSADCANVGDNEEQIKPGCIEKLLDHSPLHYATRKGHLNIVNLLLGTYQANILQVTTLGGVLHEIALGNGKQHSDMISLLFSYIGNAQLANNNNNSTMELLEKFLSLKNAHQKSVFEVLSEINNRSAQEIKRLIYEFSEQIQQLATTTTSSNSLEQQQQQKIPGGVVSAANQRQQHLNTQFGHDFLSSQQQQPQFSDIHQINSFVTMKRVPKHHQRQQQQPPTIQYNSESTTARKQHQLNNQMPMGTQTIDRRTFSSSSSRAQAERAGDGAGQQVFASGYPIMAQSNQFSHAQATHRNQHQVQAQAVAAAPMTRSVSNLNRAPIQQQRHLFDDERSNVMWQQWLSRGQTTQPTGSVGGQQQPEQQVGGRSFVGPNYLCDPLDSISRQTRKRRSKSRDLGSLLMEAHHQNMGANSKPGEHLYDNGQAASPFENASPAPSSLPGWSQNVISTTGAQLVRSQTDCSHLMGRFFGNHQGSSSSYLAAAGSGSNSTNQREQQQNELMQKQNTLDRKMINRHYHVYDHEFYPPRLLGQTPADAHKQMVAVVPPLTRQSGSDTNSLRASIRSTASTQSASQGQHKVGGQQVGGVGEGTTAGGMYSNHTNRSYLAGLHNNSRLSLNIESQVLDQAQQMAIQQQQQQMDRFLCRHSRKSATGTAPVAAPPGSSVNLNSSSDQDRCASVDQKRQELVELQRRLMAEQQQQMHNSYSLESHLSEPHLFESTRLALLHDFDRMIGQEFLNRNHQQIIDGSRIEQPRPSDAAAIGSQQSILTGVLLDMDRYGERLIVSGTRVTMPPEQQEQDRYSARQQQQVGSSKQQRSSLSMQQRRSCDTVNNSDCLSTSSTLDSSVVSTPPIVDDKLISPESNITSNSTTSHGTQTTHQTDDEDYPRDPPPKPPRLSLMNKRQQQLQPTRQKVTTSQRMAEKLQRAVIYDLPAPTTDCADPNNSMQQSRVTSNYRSSGGRNSQVTLAAQFAASAATTTTSAANVIKSTRAALTEPPKVRPPPPPPPPTTTTTSSLSTSDANLSTPLHVQPPTTGQLVQAGCLSNSNSSTSSSTNTRTNDIGLLKMASSNSSARRPLNYRHTIALQNNNQSNAANNTDPDSGVCTSNSPASLSHDSEGPPTDNKDHHDRDLVLSSCVQTTNNLKARSQKEHSAVVKHLARAGCPLSQRATPTPEQSEGALLRLDLVPDSPVDQDGLSAAPLTSPPSPKTAQLCIEEALMPLAKTTEMANQTTSPLISGSNRFVSSYSSVDVVDRWLVEGRALSPEKVPSSGAAHHQSGAEHEADYENCQSLQQQLQGARCRSISNLFCGAAEVMNNGAVCEPTDQAHSCQSSSFENNQNDDEDYAAESASDTVSGASTQSSPRSDENFLEATLNTEELNDGPQIQGTELMLKVVVDNTERASNGDEVFYINPLELKRIATKRRSQTDVETLTDEELCAAIDQNSGYIRFTLRKRRNNLINDGQLSSQTTPPAISGLTIGDKQVVGLDHLHHLPSARVAHEQEQQNSYSGVKKTKLNSYEAPNHPVVADSPLSLMKIRRNSDITSACREMPINYRIGSGQPSSLSAVSSSATGGGNARQATKLQGLSLVGGEPQVVEPAPASAAETGANRCQHEMIITTPQVQTTNKQAALRLKQWFSMNLVGLVEYISKFVDNGLDNIQFLNHPALINDKLLKSIGIDEESHRVLIVERISSELPVVNFDNLFKDHLTYEDKTPNVLKVLQVLQMDHFSRGAEQELESHCSNNSSIGTIRDSTERFIADKRLNLPLGYKARLSAALDHLSERLTKIDTTTVNKDQPIGCEQTASLTKQVSSDSSEVEMDTSQASATSSSSSKESIKSIVSMKQPPNLSDGASNPPVPVESKEVVVPKEEAENKENVCVAAKTEDRSAKLVGKPTETRTTSSLVSEVARKLEAVAAQKSGGKNSTYQRPVAAARRINTSNTSLSTSGRPGENSSDLPPVSVPVTSALSSKLSPTRSQPIQSSPKKVTAFVPVKSVCWPPNKNQQFSHNRQQQVEHSETPASTTTAIVNKLNQNKPSLSSSYQKHVDDKKNNNKIQLDAAANKLVRPKPAPPAKPAKLVAASKYNVDVGHRL